MARKRIFQKKFLIASIAGITLCFTLVISVYLFSFLLGPPQLVNDQNTIYHSNSGEVIGEERGVENRYWLSLDEIPSSFMDATLAIEDQHFYDHNGFDFKRILGAALSDFKNFSLKEGASTLTQQYARNLYLTHEKTWTRKLKEAFYTVRLEMYYSKDEILEGYLNTIYYGHGAYGVEAASRYFFDESAIDLTLAEAAMLAGIPKGPTYYSPFNDSQRAKTRQHLILNAMLDNEMITEENHYLAKREQLAFNEQKNEQEHEIAPYFQDYVLLEASNILDLDSETVRSGGYHIHTTLDVDLQDELMDKINTVIHPTSDIEVGAISMNPHTGAIQALAGGRDYEQSQYNRAIWAERMPGSAFKPFLYYAALSNGYTPSTQLMSKPTAFELSDGKVYKPANFNNYYADDLITLAQALALSDNIYAVKTNLFLGAEQLVDTARSFGIDSYLPAVPSLALGTATVTLKDMVAGYGRLANGGYEINGFTIEKIVDRQDNTVYEKDVDDQKQVLKPTTAFILSHLMTGMFDRALDGYMAVTGSSIANNITRTYAGKSGTTDSDSWMIGFSPEVVTGVWTGYDDNRPIEKVKETTYAKDVWATYMEAAHQGLPFSTFDVPSGVTGLPIDPTTGKRATPYCDTSRVMYFEKGSEPMSYCSDHYHGEERDDIMERGRDSEKESDGGIFKKWFDVFF
ncbi:transglycosylase domain-containing protein [Virgibacillus byunsanensis]|uniref:Transglycosylase domain-containing protein n=1 Tax=Virgibacillus byunsanensis TaxID=570945 RepID=A0ABW3LI08_9BACI